MAEREQRGVVLEGEVQIDTREIKTKNADKLNTVTISTDSPNSYYLQFETHILVEAPFNVVPMFLKTQPGDAVAMGHISYGHATLPDGVFHCSLAKNTAHTMAFGIELHSAIPGNHVYVINIDDDNTITPRVLQSAREVATRQFTDMSGA